MTYIYNYLYINLTFTVIIGILGYYTLRIKINISKISSSIKKLRYDTK